MSDAWPDADSAGDAAIAKGNPDDQQMFTSVGDIRIAHLELIRLASGNAAIDPTLKRSEIVGPETDHILPSADHIRAFQDKTRRAGRVIRSESDRRAAQRILDYWSAELVTRPSITAQDIISQRLAAFEGDLNDPKESFACAADETAPPAEPPSSEKALSASEETERLRIRVGAQARQWKKTEYAGYLLRGDALKEATSLPSGPDIAEFIGASIKEETASQKSNNRNWKLLVAGFATLASILAVATYFAFANSQEALRAHKEMALAFLEADQARKELGKKAAELSEENVAKDDALMRLNTAVDAANGQLAALELKRDILDSAINLIVRQLIAGRIMLSDLDPAMREEVLVSIAGDLQGKSRNLADLPFALRIAVGPRFGSVPSRLPDDLPGYQPEFLGVEIPLPELMGALALDGQDKPLNYLNYSLVMSRSRHMAIYAAANLDRASRVVLQTASSSFVADERVLPEQQPDPSWYDTTWIPAYLAGANDIAWGPEFVGEPGEAALKLAQIVNVLPNSMPQSPDFYSGVWTQLENWVRSQHNPLANQVTNFTGPAFRPEDPMIDGVPVPYAYWKVAVSSVPTASKGEADGPGFVVDAFLVPRDAIEIEFDLSRYRISISELEKIIGLDFGYLVGWSDSFNNPGPNGTAAEDLALRVTLLDSPDNLERQTLRGELFAVLAKPYLSVSQRHKVVAALVDMAQTPSMINLTATGRLNVLESLVLVPSDLWQLPDWLAMSGGARRAVGDLEMREANGEVAIGDQTRATLDRLKDHLGIRPNDQKVYLQFAGMVREEAQALTAKLRILGWDIPHAGEERIETAAGKNEVRFNPAVEADRRAAELLAADLTAAGQPAVGAVSVIGPNTLEIWVSR